MPNTTACALAPHATDPGELTEVITRLHRRFLALARRVLQDEDEAHDAVQDAYLQAVRHLDQFARDAPLSTWLHRVVVNAALMRLRARRRRPVDPFPVATLPADASSMETTVHRREMQAVVRRSLAEIGPSHRAVLVLRDLEDQDSARVARTLGVTRGALKIRAHRARRALRARLVELGVGGGAADACPGTVGEAS